MTKSATNISLQSIPTPQLTDSEHKTASYFKRLVNQYAINRAPSDYTDLLAFIQRLLFDQHSLRFLLVRDGAYNSSLLGYIIHAFFIKLKLKSSSTTLLTRQDLSAPIFSILFDLLHIAVNKQHITIDELFLFFHQTKSREFSSFVDMLKNADNHSIAHMLTVFNRCKDEHRQTLCLQETQNNMTLFTVLTKTRNRQKFLMLASIHKNVLEPGRNWNLQQWLADDPHSALALNHPHNLTTGSNRAISPELAQTLERIRQGDFSELNDFHLGIVLGNQHFKSLPFDRILAKINSGLLVNPTDLPVQYIPGHHSYTTSGYPPKTLDPIGIPIQYRRNGVTGLIDIPPLTPPSSFTDDTLHVNGSRTQLPVSTLNPSATPFWGTTQAIPGYLLAAQHDVAFITTAVSHLNNFALQHILQSNIPVADQNNQQELYTKSAHRQAALMFYRCSLTILQVRSNYYVANGIIEPSVIPPIQKLISATRAALEESKTHVQAEVIMLDRILIAPHALDALTQDNINLHVYDLLVAHGCYYETAAYCYINNYTPDNATPQLAINHFAAAIEVINTELSNFTDADLIASYKDLQESLQRKIMILIQLFSPHCDMPDFEVLTPAAFEQVQSESSIGSTASESGASTNIFQEKQEARHISSPR